MAVHLIAVALGAILLGAVALAAVAPLKDRRRQTGEFEHTRTYRSRAARRTRSGR
ncbi:hypothetical protein [Actinoplanes sp. URMC 104]|uniref:hypothetical protein n=1 Tax=Actinoplanes sp. URMC 104 TaxID=3423409 RepID=UPI003F1B0ECE